MDRTNTFTIGGRVYPARFGIMASRAISERFGGLEKMADALMADKDIAEKMDDIVFILEAVIRQGCAYKNMFESDIPKIDGAVVDKDGKYIPITKDELEIAISFDDFGTITESIFGLISNGNKQTVEAETKNADAK